MLASHALALVGVPMRRVLRVVQEQRDARYRPLRGYFHGADDDTPDELQHARSAERHLAGGQQPASVDRWAPSTSAGRRRHGGVVAAGLGRRAGTERIAAHRLAGDTLVLSGLPEALALAEGRLLQSN